MKRVFTYSFVVLMTFLVFYGGAGVNMVSFCCQDCRDAGVEVLAGDMCCEIHGHTHDEVSLEATSAAMNHSHEMCCNLKRVSFDWGCEDVSIESPQPIALDLLAEGLQPNSIITFPQTREAISVMPTGPPLPPRVYLSLLATLLI